MRLIVALLAASAAFAQSFPSPGPGRAAVGGGSTPPSVGTAVTGTSAINGSGNFVLGSVTASANDALFVIFGYRASSESVCDEVTAGSSDNGATFSKVPSGTIGDQVAACAKSWIAYNVNSGSHVITLNGNLAGAMGTITYVVVPIHRGSLTGTTDASCSGKAAGPSASCGTSVGPSTSLAMLISGAFSWDPGTFTAGSGFTIAGQVNGGLGTAAAQYQVLNPPSGSYTPSITAPSGGDGVVITGIVIK